MLKKYFFFLFLLAALFISSATAHAASTIQVNPNITGLNMRQGPGMDYKKLELLAPSTKATLLYTSTINNEKWHLIALQNGLTGWVFAEYTSPSSGTVFQPGEKIDKKITVEASSLNLRAGPDTSFTQIDRLPRGTICQAIYEKNGWLLVLLNNGKKAGWVAGWYTSANISAPAENDLPALEKSSGGDTLIMKTAPGWDIKEVNTEQLKVLKSEGQWIEVLMADSKRGWILGEIVGGSYKGQAFTLAEVQADGLRIRSGPGLDFDIKGRVNRGDHLLLLKKENNWAYILSPDNTKGWISMDYVKEKPLPLGEDQSFEPILIAFPGSASNFLSGKTIVIDPGHGGQDPGATGKNGLKEKDVNLTTSLALANILRKLGAEVVLTRKSDVYLTLDERVAVAEKERANIFISIHANAHPSNTFTSGTETYYYRDKATAGQSYSLGQFIQGELTTLLQLPGRGVKHGNFHVIRETSMPSVLLELAFLSNAVDENLLAHKPLLEEVARAIAKGVVKYFKEGRAY